MLGDVAWSAIASIRYDNSSTSSFFKMSIFHFCFMTKNEKFHRAYVLIICLSKNTLKTWQIEKHWQNDQISRKVDNKYKKENKKHIKQLCGIIIWIHFDCLYAKNIELAKLVQTICGSKLKNWINIGIMIINQI